MAKRTDKSLTPQILIGESIIANPDQFPYSAQPMTNGKWSIYSYYEIVANRVKNDLTQQEAETLINNWNKMFWGGAQEGASTAIYVKHD